MISSAIPVRNHSRSSPLPGNWSSPSAGPRPVLKLSGPCIGTAQSSTCIATCALLSGLWLMWTLIVEQACAVLCPPSSYGDMCHFGFGKAKGSFRFCMKRARLLLTDWELTNASHSAPVSFLLTLPQMLSLALTIHIYFPPATLSLPHFSLANTIWTWILSVTSAFITNVLRNWQTSSHHSSQWVWEFAGWYHSHLGDSAYHRLSSIPCSTPFKGGALVWRLAYDTCHCEYLSEDNPVDYSIGSRDNISS